MPQQVLTYFIQLIDETSFKLQILDVSSGLWQIYLNNTLRLEFNTITTTIEGFNINDKVDILSITSGESGFDFSSTLNDNNGDKVKILIPSGYIGVINIYGDSGRGIIDYGNKLASVNITGSCQQEGFGDLPQGDYQWGMDETASICAIFTTGRLHNGENLFSLVPVDNSGNHLMPLIISEEINSVPDEIKYQIRKYEDDEIVVEVLE